MVKPEYLIGLRPDPTDSGWPNDIYAFTMRGSTNYVSSYSVGNNFKSKLFGLLGKSGQTENKGSWHFHHIVERQHFAITQPGGCSDQVYLNVLPCILLSEEQHYAINSLLHSSASRLWTAGASNNLSMNDVISNLREMYHMAYIGFPVMQTIADNVLKNELRKTNSPNLLAVGVVNGAPSWHTKGKGLG